MLIVSRLCTGVFGFIMFVMGACNVMAEKPSRDQEGFFVFTIAPSNPKVYVEQKTIDAKLSPFDVHVMRVASTKQTISSTQLCDEFDDFLVSKDAYFMTDYRDHDGVGFGYNVFHTKNGHQIVVKTTGNTQMVAGKDLADESITGMVLSGTGPFAGVIGDYQSKGQFNWKAGQIKSVRQVLRLKISQQAE